MMIISDTIKNAFKNPEREIRGYVEMFYSNDTVKDSASFESNFELYSASIPSELFNNDRLGSSYASFENGYFTLNGTMGIVGTSNEGIAVLSNDIYSNIADPSFTIKTTSTTAIDGVTIYFKDNIVKSATAVLNGAETYNVTSGKSFIQIAFNNPTAVNTLKVTINEVERPDWRIRIQEVDFGLTSLYEGNEIIGFDITEQVSKLVEELPVNELKLTIGNYDKEFDPINPKGLTKYLSSKTILKPYIGIVIGDKVEYICMGEYYLYSWDNEENTTIFVGRNILEKVSQEPITDNGTYFSVILEFEELKNYLSSNYEYQIEINRGIEKNISPTMTNYSYLKEFLMDYALRMQAIIYGDRSNIIHIDAINNDVVETLSRNEVLQNPQFKIKDKINTVKLGYDRISRDDGVYDGTEQRFVTAEATVTLSKPQEVFCIRKFTGYNMSGLEVTQTGGADAEIIGYGGFMVFVKVTGDVGSSVELTLAEYNWNASSTETFTTYSNRKDGEDAHTFEFKSGLNYFVNGDYLGEYILREATQYQVNANYIGLPYLCAGDTVSIETEYGYKNVFIERSTLKYDGGLSGSIMGVSK